MDLQSKPDQFDANAQECERLSALATDLIVRDQFRSLASQWRELSQILRNIQNERREQTFTRWK